MSHGGKVIFKNGCLFGRCFQFSFNSLLLLGHLSISLQPIQAQTVIDPTVCSDSNGPSWCSGSDIGAWIAAAASYLGAGGGKIQIPAGTWTQTTEVSIISGSNIEIAGEGESATYLVSPAGVLSNNGGPGRNFYPVGTAITPVTNLSIHDLSIQNGPSNPTAAVRGNDGVRCEYCNAATFYNLNITQIQGLFGIATINSNNIWIHDNTISNFGYGGIINSVDCEPSTLTTSQCLEAGASSSNIWVESNNVSHCMFPQTSENNCYGIGISGYDTPNAMPATNGAWVLNNTVNDIPTWECYDSHGGTNQHFEGNVGTNCYLGVSVGPIIGDWLQDVTVRGNTLTQYDGTGNSSPMLNGYGIVVNGQNLTSMVSGAIIDNNTISSYGSGPSAPSDYTGDITLYNTVNSLVENNVCTTYYQACINLYHTNLYTTIESNISLDMLGANASSVSSEILFSATGNWGVWIDGSISNPSSASYAPMGLLNNNYNNSQVSLGPNNKIEGSGSTVLATGNWYPVGVANPPGSNGIELNYQCGDTGYDSSYAPIYTLTGPNYGSGTGFYGLDTIDVVATGTVVANSNIISSLSGGKVEGKTVGVDWWDWLPAGMNVVIAGAGPSGADLLTQITGNDGSQLTLADNASTSTNANIYWQGGSYEAYSANLPGSCSPVKNTGYTSQIGTTPVNSYSYYAKNATLSNGVWSQDSSAQPSTLYVVNASGVTTYSASAGEASGPSAGFWGASL